MRTANEDHAAVERLAVNYSNSAEGYAELWSPVIRPVARRMLEALPWERACRVLDVGTGTGALIPDILSLAPSARIVAIDRSLGMLNLARGARAHLATMDAMGLGIRAGAFDVAVMAFVLFHVPEPSAALMEIKRVLGRGGTVGVTTWAESPATPATQTWEEELAAQGAWDPSPQLPDRDDLMNTNAKVSDLLAAAGFTPGRIWTEPVEYQWDVAPFMNLRTRLGTTKRKLGTLDPRKREACLARIGERMARLSPKDLLCRGTAICAVAAF